MQNDPISYKLMRWLVYVVVFLVPILFLPWSSELLETNKQFLLVIAALLSLVLYLVNLLRYGGIYIKKSRLYLPLVTVWLASLLAAIFSKNPLQSFLGVSGGVQAFSFITLSSAMVIFFVAINFMEYGGGKIKKLLAFSLGLALLFSFLQLFGFFLIGKAPFNTFNFNTVGSLNSLAIMGAVLLPLLWELEIKVFKFLDLSKVIAFLALVLILFVNWWLVWLVAFVAMLSWMGFKTAETKTANTRMVLLPMILIAIGIFAMLIRFSLPIISQRLPVEVSTSYKTAYDIAVKTLKDKPLFGYGQGEFVLAYEKFKPSSIAASIFSGTRFNQSSSSFLNLVTEGGLVMLAAVIFLLVFIVNELRKSRSSSAYLTFSAVVIFSLAPFNVTLLTLFFLALAILELQKTGAEDLKYFDLKGNYKSSIVASFVFVLGFVSVLFGAYFSVTRYISDIYFAKALRAQDRDIAINELGRSINLNPKDTRGYRTISQALIGKIAAELNNKDSKLTSQERGQRVQNLSTNAISLAKTATDIDPEDSQNWLNRGVVLQNLVGLISGADTEAVSMYNEALKRVPNNPVIFNSIGSIHLAVADLLNQALANPPKDQTNFNPDDIRKRVADNFAKAEDNFKKAIAINNNYGQPIYNLSAVYEREGRLDQSIKQLEKLRLSTPNDPSIALQLGLLYYRNNQKDKAFNSWQQATTLFPNYSNARWYLSLLYEERGDLDNATKQVEEIVKLNPDNDVAKQRLEDLKGGKRIIPPGKVLDQKPLNR